MDNKQILEEIDIIVRARVEGVRNELKKVSKEANNMVNSVSKSMNNLDSNNLDLIKESFKSLSPEVSDAMDKIADLQSKIEFLSKQKTISDYQLQNISKFKHEIEELKKSLSFKSDDENLDFNTSNIEELENQLKILDEERTQLVEKFRNNDSIFTNEDSARLDELVLKIHEIEELLSTIPRNTDLNIEATGTIQQIDSSNQIGELKKINEEIYSLEERLRDFDMLSIKEQIATVGMQVQQTFPQINSLVEKFKERINESDSLLGMFVSKLQQTGQLGKSVSEKIVSAFSNVKIKISSAFTETFESVKLKIGPLGSILSNIEKISKNVFIQASSNVKELSNKFTNPINKAKDFINKIKNIGKEFDSQKKKGSSFSTEIGKGLNKGIKSIKKFALSLLSIRTAFSAISKASQAYLSFNTDLSDQLQNCWNVLGSLLAPVLEYIIGLFTKLVSVVAQFVKSLTGIDLVARANAKALDKQNKAASKSKSLSGIDDIDNLSTGNGENSTTLKVEDIDINPFEEFFYKVKKIFSEIFKPFVLAWENVGSDVFNSILETINSISELGSSVFSSMLEVWTNGTGQTIIENYIILFQTLIEIIGGIAQALSNAWNNAGTGTSIIQSISNIFNTIQKFVISIADSILKWVVSDNFQEALNRVFTFIGDIFEIVETIASWMLEMYDKYIKPVIDEKLLPAISSIILALSDIWNFVQPLITNLIIPIIQNQLEPVIKGLCGFIGGIIDVVKGIAEFISGIFTSDWRKAWNGIKNIFSGIWSSLASIIKIPINQMLSGVEFLINKLISGFNSLIKGINKISFDVPDWIPGIGGKKWGFNIKQSNQISLPRLATGDVAYEETAVIVGEYANARQNPEIISPVSMMEDSFRRVLDEKDSGGTRIETLKIDVAGENFYQGTVDYINEENTRKGVNIIKEV